MTVFFGEVIDDGQIYSGGWQQELRSLRESYGWLQAELETYKRCEASLRQELAHEQQTNERLRAEIAYLLGSKAGM